MNNILDKIKNTRILAGFGIVCLILGVITKYVKFSVWGFSYSVSLLEYWEGKVIIILAIVNLLFIFKDLLEKYVPALFNNGFCKKIANLDSAKFSLIPTILVAVFAIYLLVSLDIDSSYASYGVGFYALWIGVICLVAYAILHRKKEEDKKI